MEENTTKSDSTESKKPTPEEIENKYWKNAVGTTSLSERGYRSFWD